MRFEEIFPGAQWVAPAQDCACPLMRENIIAGGDIASASVNICGLGFFELYINGTKVSGDMFAPVTSDYCEQHFVVDGVPFGEKLRHRTYYVHYDITGMLHPGENAFCVMLAPGWFGQNIQSCDTIQRYGDVRLAYAVDLQLESGVHQKFASGAGTRWAQGPVTEYDLFLGETQDMRLSHDGWLMPDYDGGDFKPCRILDDMETGYMLQDCPADAVIRHIRPVLLSEKGGVKIYDAGENISGMPVLSAHGSSGERVELRLGEELDADGALEQARMHGQFASFTLDGRPRTLRTRFTWHGFRYFSVTGPAEVQDCMVVHADVPVTSEFDSDNPALNWLYDAYIRTQLCNMHAGIPSDCPHIERRGYTGDGELTCQSAMLTLGAREFYRKWLRDIEDCQDDITGHVQYTAPYTRCGGGPGGWGCAIVHVPYCYYLQYGDAEPMRRMMPRMLKYFDYLESHSENGLITSDNPGQWCLGDWCTPEKIAIPAPFVNNYFYIKSMLELLKIGSITGIHDYDAMLAARIAERAAAIDKNYFDEATGDYAGNIQGANAFAVDIGLGDARTFNNLLRHYTLTGCYDTGIFGTDIVTRVLFEHGCAQTAFDLLASEKEISFDTLRKKGATTLWEYWTGERSHSHPMFGAVVQYLFEYLLGIGQRSAGWDKVVIAPQPVNGMNYISGSVLTPHGRIGVRMNRIDDQLVFDVHADEPENAVFCIAGREYALKEKDSRFTVTG